MRILVADHQIQVRYGLRVLLEQHPTWQIVGEARDADALFAQLADTAPDVLLIDWGLPGLQAVGSLTAVRSIIPHAVIITLSSRPELRREALSAGADAFVSKVDPPEHLLSAIEACVAHETHGTH